MKKSNGIFIGCGGLLIVGIFAGAILGFIGYRNMNPNPSVEDVPEIAGTFKKDRLTSASGNPFGTTKAFTADYSSTVGGKNGNAYIFTQQCSRCPSSDAIGGL